MEVRGISSWKRVSSFTRASGAIGGSVGIGATAGLVADDGEGGGKPGLCAAEELATMGGAGGSSCGRARGGSLVSVDGRFECGSVCPGEVVVELADGMGLDTLSAAGATPRAATGLGTGGGGIEPLRGPYWIMGRFGDCGPVPCVAGRACCCCPCDCCGCGGWDARGLGSLTAYIVASTM